LAYFDSKFNLPIRAYLDLGALISKYPIRNKERKQRETCCEMSETVFEKMASSNSSTLVQAL
jgi:hypothetical protein